MPKKSMGEKRGIALNTKYASGGDAFGHGIHKIRMTGKKRGTPTDVRQPSSPAPREPVSRKRGSKPPSKAVSKTPAVGKGRGPAAGQSVGKIV